MVVGRKYENEQKEAGDCPSKCLLFPKPKSLTATKLNQIIWLGRTSDNFLIFTRRGLLHGCGLLGSSHSGVRGTTRDVCNNRFCSNHESLSDKVVMTPVGPLSKLYSL